MHKQNMARALAAPPLLTSFRNLSPITWAIFIGYILLLIFFDTVDTYHHHFFSTGFTVIAYNLMRVLFIGYLMWLFFIAGDCFLTYVAKNSYNRLMTTESALLGFFTGVGIWHIILLCVGFAGCYNRALMAAMTLLLFATSLPRLDSRIRHITSQRSYIYWPGLLLLVIPVSVFLMTKGLYPAGGHDYYNHYFHFYRKVIDSGSILPNEVWYHFYYSKGLALFFLSMLLTDPLAPQLATTAMIFAGAGVIFSILNKTASWRLLPWIGAALYITFLIYTPGPFENMRQGGWGDLEKTHEPAAVLMLAVIWITMRLEQTSLRQVWGITLVSSISALVLISPVMTFFLGAYLFVIALYFITRKQKAAAFWSVTGMAVAGSWLVFLWLANYLLTGLPDDQSLLFFWQFINFDKIKEWGVLFELVSLNSVKTGLEASKVALTIDILPKIISYLRLDVWAPLLLLSVSLFSINLCWSNTRISAFKALDENSLYPLCVFLLLIVSLSLIIGRDQPISFYRFTTFTYAPMMCFCLLLLSAVLRNWRSGILLIIILGFSTHWAMTTQRVLLYGNIGTMIKNGISITMGNYNIKKIEQVITNGIHFIKGHYSISDGYKNQQGWPGRMPSGGIYPASETIWKQLPLKTRIWSMHVHSYCMLPDCHMEGYMSYQLSPHADLIYFGDPRKAKELLKKENLNFFFYSNSLQLTDPLPLTPLFSPKHIADYLGIAWTDGDNTLLTWKEQARIPIDSAWVKRYNQRVKESPTVQSFPYNSMRIVLDTARNENRLQSTDLPWNT